MDSVMSTECRPQLSESEPACPREQPKYGPGRVLCLSYPPGANRRRALLERVGERVLVRIHNLKICDAHEVILFGQIPM